MAQTRTTLAKGGPRDRLSLSKPATFHGSGTRSRRCSCTPRRSPVDPVSAGALRAGKGSQAIHLWRAGPDGPLFLEKITATQSEFAAFRHLIGRDVDHLPAVLGALSYRFNYHLFMTVAAGTPLDIKAPDFSTAPLVEASFGFSRSLGSATQSLAGIETQSYALIQTPWVRKLLTENDVPLATLDGALATTRTVPQHLIHNDLHFNNVLHDAETGENWLIDLGMLMVSNIGAEVHPFALIAANHPDNSRHFEEAVVHLAHPADLAPQTVRQSCLTHCIEVNMRRAINHKSANRFASVVKLCGMLTPPDR